MRKSTSWILALFLAAGLLSMNSVLAKGSELNFESEVVAVSDQDGVVVIVVHGAEIPVNVDRSTELADGDVEIALAELLVGDFIKVEAHFESSAIVAEEIKILQRENEEFRLRGRLSAVDFGGSPTPTTSLDAATITVLGTEIMLDHGTRINARGRGRGRGSKLPASRLAVGDEVDVRGYYNGSSRWAERVKVGERASGKIDVEGEFREYTGDGFIIVLRQAGDLHIKTDTLTEVTGELAEGVEVEVEGVLTESLAVLASVVEVKTARGKGKGKAKAKGAQGKPGAKHGEAQPDAGNSRGQKANGDNQEKGKRKGKDKGNSPGNGKDTDKDKRRGGNGNGRGVH